MGATTSSSSTCAADPVAGSSPKCICIPLALKDKDVSAVRTGSSHAERSRSKSKTRERKGSAGDVADSDANQTPVSKELEAGESKVDGYPCRETMVLEEVDLRRKLATLNISENIKSNEIEVVTPSDGHPKDVLYYAWFFSPSTSKVIKEIADAYLMECRKVPQFERFLNDACLQHGAKDPTLLYRHPRKQKLKDEFKYHVTAKFIGRENHVEYSQLVEKFVGRTFRLPLSGLFFTAETFGIRVDLTEGQKLLFDERDGGSCSSSSSPSPRSLASSYLRSPNTKTVTVANAETVKKIDIVENELQNPAPLPKRHAKCKSPLHERFSDNPEISLLPSLNPLRHPPKSRAHITIGCVPKVLPVQAGTDLRDIVDLESRETTKTQDFQIDGGTLRQFGHGRFDEGDAFVVYPHHKILVDAIFQYHR